MQNSDNAPNGAGDLSSSWTSGNLSRLSPDRVRVLKRHLVGTSSLDVGCAYGAYTEFVRLHGMKSFGCDIRTEIVQTARTQYTRGHFVAATSLNLPFGNSTFDNVLLFDVLEHVDQDRVLEEVTRVCRGHIIASLPLKAPIALSAHGLVYWHYQDPSHLRYYTQNDIEDLFRKHSLNILDFSLSDPVELREALANSIPYGGLLGKLLRKMILRIRVTHYWQTALVVAAVPDRG
jgi:2-polyprenyl-3-methyl-5-hydroxy-6-metoxy-1,4-benzoquinol methylase